MDASYDQICVTLDVDWAIDAVLADVIGRLEDAGVKATFFATHQSELLANLNPNQFEVALHPNFNDPALGFEKPVMDLKDLYPDAVGGRSHGLFVSSNILQCYRKSGLRYESNIFLHKHEGLHPVLRFKDLISIPFIWSDDKHLEIRSKFDLSELCLTVSGLKVLNFHPMHVFINSPNSQLYEECKKDFHKRRWLESLRNRGAPGIGTLFNSLLNWLKQNEIPTLQMRQLQETFDSDRHI